MDSLLVSLNYPVKVEVLPTALFTMVDQHLRRADDSARVVGTCIS